MNDNKWYFDNDPDRHYEENDFLCRLDFIFHGRDKMMGKGVRDSLRRSPVRIIDSSIESAVSSRTNEVLEGCDTYWYHQRKYWRSIKDKDILKLINLYEHNREIPDGLFGKYYLGRAIQ